MTFTEIKRILTILSERDSVQNKRVNDISVNADFTTIPVASDHYHQDYLDTTPVADEHVEALEKLQL